MLAALKADLRHDPPTAEAIFPLEQRNFIRNIRLDKGVLGTRHGALDDFTVD